MALVTEEIIPNVNLRLALIDRQHAVKFRAAFLSTWGSLPEATIEILTTYWDVNQGTAFLTRRWEGSRPKIAQCGLLGTMLWFKSSVVEWIPDSTLGICIAHELAHAFLYATQDPYHCTTRFGENIDRRLAEAVTYELVNVWGFRSAELRHWCADNFERLSREAE